MTIATLLSKRDQAASGVAIGVNDTLMLKGLAIASIVLHNFFHLFGPVQQNEFHFRVARFTTFLHAMQDPRHAVQGLFSFFGHYGVEMFMFLSAYGLAIRYWETSQSWGEFLWSRIKKIYPTFFLAIIVWALYITASRVNPVEIFRHHLGNLALTVVGVQNLVPGADLPPVGPWWFLPFIMQFYCIWPGIKWVAKRYDVRGLIGLSCVSIALLYLANDYLDDRWAINLLETPIGHMPELCLGILVARYRVVPGRIALLAGALLTIGGNMERALWPLSFIGALVVMLAIYRFAGQGRRHSALIERLGTWSMAMFFVNGFVRLPLVAIAQRMPWTYGLLAGLFSFVLTVLIAQLLYRTEQMLRGIAIRWRYSVASGD